MLGRTYGAEVCSAARSLELVGERWTLLIIRNAHFAHHSRFTDFQRSLGIATNVLAARLEGLLDSGIMERSIPHAEAAPPEYKLTQKGRELVPVLLALTAWGDRWATPGPPPMTYLHTECGGPVTLRSVCSECGEIRDPDEITVRHGPGWDTAVEARDARLDESRR